MGLYEHLERIGDTIPDGIVIVDRNRAITYANTAAEEILGLPRQVIVSRRIDDLKWKIHTEDGSALREEEIIFPRVMRTREPIHGVEYSSERPDGSRVTLSVNAGPLLRSEEHTSELQSR